MMTLPESAGKQAVTAAEGSNPPMNHRISRYFGTRAFYRMVMAIAVPIMLQNGITNFVSLLDNIMVGQVGTAQMSGVAIVNQILFVFNLGIFGGLSGAGIFTAQYYGRGDQQGVLYTARFKLLLGVVITLIAMTVLICFGQPLILSYLNGDSEELPAALASAESYLQIMLWGLPAFMAVQVYASTLRECGETMLPMAAGITAVLVNLAGNWLFIFGQLGFPAMGVNGAALATVVSRYVELLIVAVWTHLHADRFPFVRELYASLHIPAALMRRIAAKGSPLLLNELLWSGGMAVLTQCYSLRGLDVVAAENIANTICNLFNIMFLSLGSSVAIVVGQQLGAGRMEEARASARRMIVFSILSSTVMALLLYVSAPLFPRLYNTTDAVRALAVEIMRVTALFMPQMAFMNAAYFVLRSGGRTFITFLFDSVAIWAVSIPIAWVLATQTDWPVTWILVAVNLGNLIKCVLGYILVKRGTWVRNMVAE